MDRALEPGSRARLSAIRTAASRILSRWEVQKGIGEMKINQARLDSYGRILPVILTCMSSSRNVNGSKRILHLMTNYCL